jgi:hypothetical protein
LLSAGHIAQFDYVTDAAWAVNTRLMAVNIYRYMQFDTDGEDASVVSR